MTLQPPTANPTHGVLSEFLTPESMLTPGIAGALTMMITNAISVNFNFPRAWVGLILSFMVGTIVFATDRRIFQRSVYYVLNSLVIFCVAIGSNAAVTTQSNRVAFALFSEANAQTPPTLADKLDKYQQLNQQIGALSIAVEAAKKANLPPDQLVILSTDLDKLQAARSVLQNDITTQIGNNPNSFKDFKDISGGPNSEVRNIVRDPRFFQPWKF